MTQTITSLIEYEKTQPLSKRRKEILHHMADFRGSLALAAADIRAYLLSAELRFKESHLINWRLNQQSTEALKKLSSLLTPFERKLLDELCQRRDLFEPLPEQIFQLREQEDWNKANFLLKTVASRLGGQLTRLLDAMVEDQRRLLELDNQELVQDVRQFILILLLLSMLGIGFTIWLGFKINKKSAAEQKAIAHRASLIDQNILIASLDQDGVILEISNALCRLRGSVQADLVGKASNFFFTEAGAQQQQIDSVLKTIQTGKEWEGEIQWLDQNGEKNWFLSTLIPVYGAGTGTGTGTGHEISGYTNILQDITDKKNIESMAITDKLTSLYNRRHFDQVIDQELKLARRRGTSLTLAILDIDYFKKYNDQYGHQAGDMTLANVAHAMRESMNRPDDFVFRLGGEEFGVVFNGLDVEKSRTVLEKIRNSILNLRIEHCLSDVNKHVTVSIGGKVCQAANMLPKEEFYLAADRALYEAKKNRNTVVVAG